MLGRLQIQVHHGAHRQQSAARGRLLVQLGGLGEEGLDLLVLFLAQELDDQIINGDGVVDATHDNFLGILNTSGTKVQPWNTSITTTTRKAITALQEAGYTPTAWVLSPSDAEAVDLLADTTQRPLGDGPFASGPNTLWSLPRVTSTAVPAGTAIVGDWGQAVLAVREQATISVSDQHQDYFVRNLVAFLGEQRTGFALARPDAFVEVDMTVT
jgi:HK97 family phage major capsid protein